MARLHKKCAWAMVLVAAVSAPAIASLPLGETLDFALLRDGKPIGRHLVTIRETGPTKQVDVAIDIEVKVLFLTVFQYRHRNREIWRDGRLVSLDTWTDDDGDTFEVTARATDQGLQVDGAEGRFVAPAEIIPTSYWHPATTAQTRLLDTQRGRILAVSVMPSGEDIIDAEGEPIEAKRYTVSGDLELTLWYGSQQNWVKTAFEARGAQVQYVLDNRSDPPRPQNATTDESLTK